MLTASQNIAYAMIFIPGTGILAAYTDPKTGEPTAELNQALALLVWAWLIVAVIFTVSALRSSWALLLALVFADVEFIFLAAAYMSGNAGLLLASRGVGFVTAFCSCESRGFSKVDLQSLIPDAVDWAAASGLWSPEMTPIRLPVGRLGKDA